jgi:hypothetical protein
MPETRSYLIRHADRPVRLAADDPCWEHADRLEIDQFPWYDSGLKQHTDVALLYDDDALYALFICADRHIQAVETRPNGNVYLDSCVEMFAQPAPDWDSGYFNFEANCCGAVHLGWGAERTDRRLAPPSVHNSICVVTSIPADQKLEAPDDDGWWLAASLPFAAIGELAGFRIAPECGAVWRANFYRCGGETDPQFACWNCIETDRPDYHRPEHFGRLRFE